MPAGYRLVTQLLPRLENSGTALRWAAHRCRTTWLPGRARGSFRGPRRWWHGGRGEVPPFTPDFPAFAARSSRVQYNGKSGRSCSPS